MSKEIVSVISGTNFPEKIFNPYTPPSYAPLTKQDNGDGTFSIVSDISLLINERALIDRIGIDNVRRMLNDFNTPQGSAFDRWRKGLSDQDLLQMVKPRNIQTPSELNSWFTYLSQKEEHLAALAKSSQSDNDVDNSSDDNSSGDTSSSE